MDATSQDRRIVLITGANAGIGRRAAAAIAAAGHTVIAVARDRERGERAVAEIRAETGVDRVHLELADMASLASVAALAGRLRDTHQRIDALIHNAAVFDQTAARSVTAEGHEVFWATNHLGPVALTGAVLPLLDASDDARVVAVASKGLVAYPRIAIRWDDPEAERWFTPTRAYYHAKLAQVMAAAALARRMPEERLLSIALRVPAVRLDVDRLAAMPRRLRWAYAPKNRFAASPDALAATYARLAVGPRAALEGLHGRYVDEHLAPVPPPRSAREEAAQDRLWALTSTADGMADVAGALWEGLPPAVR